MMYDFDKIHNRAGTNSIKWDFSYQDGELKTLASGSSDMLPMWLADMDFQTAPEIVEALVERAQHGIYGYTKPTDSYYQAITNWMWRRYGWRLEKEWILVSAGVVPAINMAIQAYTEPGDKIIIQTPVFHPFAQSIENNGRVVLRNFLLFEGGQYVMDFDDLEAKAADPQTKMIILCSPHNPVGRVWSHYELMRLGQICQQHDLLIVSDEIHSDLIYSWVKFTTFGAVDVGFNDRLILCNGPTKTFNLPGMKTSSTIIPNPVLREKFSVILRNLNELFSVSTFGTLALQTAYEQGAPWLTQLMTYLEENYQFLREYVEQHIPSLRVQDTEALYLIWVDCRELGLDAEALKNFFLDDAKVYLEQGNTYGVEGEGFVRFNIACPRKTLEEALKRINRAVAGLEKRE